MWLSLLGFHNFFKDLDTSSIRIGEVSNSIGIGYVKKIEVFALHEQTLSLRFFFKKKMAVRYIVQ